MPDLWTLRTVWYVTETIGCGAMVCWSMEDELGYGRVTRHRYVRSHGLVCSAVRELYLEWQDVRQADYELLLEMLGSAG